MKSIKLITIGIFLLVLTMITYKMAYLYAEIFMSISCAVFVLGLVFFFVGLFTKIDK